jgi:hypothetical protein
MKPTVTAFTTETQLSRRPQFADIWTFLERRFRNYGPFTQHFLDILKIHFLTQHF